MSARRPRQLYVVNRSSSSSEGEDGQDDGGRARYRRPTRSPAYPRNKLPAPPPPPPLPKVPAPSSKPPTPLSTTNLIPGTSAAPLSLSSPSSAADDTPPPSTPDPRTSPVTYVRPQPKPPPPAPLPKTPLGKVWILVTKDAERYTRIDISGAQDANAIRDAIFSKLEIFDEKDQAQYAVFKTDFGSTAMGEPLSNDRLFDLCQEQGDAKASLLFSVMPYSGHHRELPPPPPVPLFPPSISPSPSSDYSPSRSRNGSISSTSENALGYDADLDNNEDDRRFTMRPPPQPISVSLPSSGITPPSSSRPMSPLPHFPSNRPTSPPDQPSHSLSPKVEQPPTIVDRAGNIYPVPPPPPPLSPHRPSFEASDETTPTTSFRTPSSAASTALTIPDSPPTSLVENGIKQARQPTYSTGKVVSPTKDAKDAKPRKRLPQLDYEPQSPDTLDSPLRSSPVSSRSSRAPVSPSSARYNKSSYPRTMNIQSGSRGATSAGPSSTGRTAGQPVPASWAVSWKPEASKPLSSSSTNWSRLTKGAKSMDNLRSGGGSSGTSRRPNQLPMARQNHSREPPTPPVPKFDSSSQRSHHRPLPMQGSALGTSLNPQLDIRVATGGPSRSTMLSTPTSNEPYPRPSSAFGEPVVSPSQKYPSRHLQSPTYTGEGSETRSPRGVSPIRPLHPSILLSSRSVPPSDLDPRSSVESPPQSPPSPQGGRPPRDRLLSDTGLPDYRSPTEPTLRPDDTMLNHFFASTSTSFTSSSAASEESTFIAEDDSDGSESSIWARGPTKPELVIQTSSTPSTSSLSPSQTRKLTAPGSSSPVKRSRRDVKSNGSTFKDRGEETWAPRPPPEDLYEEMEKYFPNHDVDKPVLESTSGGASPTNPEPELTVALPPPVAPLATSKAKKAQHKKSLRMAAGEHISNRKRISHAEAAAAYPSAISRRMTRLWGSRLEEVTTEQHSRAVLAVTPESPSGGASTFKWVRGELIGKGTYGRVYLALNATTGEMMAVKQVEIPQTASDLNDSRQATVVQALKLESETLKDLDHPNIVQYLGFEETPSNLSIFLEYVPGGSIGSCLQRHGKFDEDVTKSFTLQILSGLEYLHSKNILHRDLKADNILVETTGICKISDFGISKRTDDLSGGAHTAMQGTVFWMAPEVISTAEKGYNSKIDIWSVGCVVLEMWAGSRPWSGSEMMAVMFKLYHEKKPPPVPDDVILSPLADDFRQKCFAINPEDRPSAAALRKHPYLELPDGWAFNGFK